MKLLEQLMEMARSKSRRARENKASRQKKLESPTLDKTKNPVHMAAQKVGAGEHTLKKGKGSESGKKARTRRKEDLKNIIKGMD